MLLLFDVEATHVMSLFFSFYFSRACIKSTRTANTAALAQAGEQKENIIRQRAYKESAKITPDGTRTRNLLLRRQTPYPLGYEGNHYRLRAKAAYNMHKGFTARFLARCPSWPAASARSGRTHLGGILWTSQLPPVCAGRGGKGGAGLALATGPQSGSGRCLCLCAAVIALASTQCVAVLPRATVRQQQQWCVARDERATG